MPNSAKRLVVFVVLCLCSILLIIPFIDDTGLLAWVALGGFALALVSGLGALFSLPPFLNEFWSPEGVADREEYYAKRLEIVLGIAFVISLVALSLEIDNIDNTLGGTALFLSALAFGGVGAFVVFILFSGRFPFIWKDGRRRFSTIASLVLTMGFLGAASANYANRLYASSTLEELSIRVERKGKSSEKTEHYLFLDINGVVNES